MNRKLCIKIALLWIWTAFFAPLNVAAEPVRSSEYLVKATYLYNFARFTEWPSEMFDRPDAPVIICILGKAPFGDAFRIIKDKVVRGRPLLIRQCQDIRKIKECHILFITSSEEANLAKILSSIKGLPSLTVSDMEGFVQRGGIVRLFTAGNKIRFEVNPQAAKRSFLKISSKLLKLAKIFEEDPAKKGN